MKIYGDLNLKKLRNDCGLDFAHFTYQRNQCSCCYGPKDMPERYWASGKKPKMINPTYREDGTLATFQWDRKDEDIQYILFKNANNGCGIVTRKDTICVKSRLQTRWSMSRSENLRVCIEWQFPEEKMDRVLQALSDQLDDDYAVIRPESSYYCIEIVLKSELREDDLSKVFVPRDKEVVA